MSGLTMMLGALGIDPKMIEELPAIAEQFKGFIDRATGALLDMEQRQKRIEAMQLRILEHLGVDGDAVGNGTETGTGSMGVLAIEDGGGNGRLEHRERA